MYNYSGLWYRIYGVDITILLMGIVLILFNKPWSKPFMIKKYLVAFAAVALALVLGAFDLYCIYKPNVSSYKGEFIDTHRNSRVAPPLPFTYEYVFWNGEGEKPTFYIDVFSKKEIFPDEFVQGEEYIIYYDKYNSVIVKVTEIDDLG